MVGVHVSLAAALIDLHDYVNKQKLMSSALSSYIASTRCLAKRREAFICSLRHHCLLPEHVYHSLVALQALRTCPLCRSPCWFVTPSSIWPANQEDKDRIVAGYKAKLGSIDCRHWNFGENTCPFGTSCFYRHIYPDGRPQVIDQCKLLTLLFCQPL